MYWTTYDLLGYDILLQLQKVNKLANKGSPFRPVVGFISHSPWLTPIKELTHVYLIAVKVNETLKKKKKFFFFLNSVQRCPWVKSKLSVQLLEN